MLSPSQNQIVILLVICKQNNVYFIANDKNNYPGIYFTKQHSSQMFVDEMNAFVQKTLLYHPKMHPLEWLQVDAGNVQLSKQTSPDPLLENAQLHLIKTPEINDTIKLDNNYTWQTMPALLRAMPKNRQRLPYLKAFEYLQGTTESQIKVLDKIPIEGAKH